MPLSVKTQAEPFTDQSRVTLPILAESDEYERLYRDLKRYTYGEIQGRSYLIAGHRGSGKTTLVYKAIEDLLRDSVDKQYRPLFVRLHGPDLLPPEPTQAGAAAARPGGGGGKGDKAKGGKPKTPAGGGEGDDAAEAEAKRGEERPEGELEVVLRQMMKSLFQTVAVEYRRAYRERALRMPPGLKRQQLLEVASQFDLELTEAITESLTPARLRSYWARADALGEGILFQRSQLRRNVLAGYKREDSDQTGVEALAASDMGLQEILVLSFLSESFQVIAGQLQQKQSRTDADRRESVAALSAAYALKNLFGPVAGLLTGGFVGIQIGKEDPVAAVLLGLLTGAVVSLGFSFSSSKTRTRGTSLESVFIPDRSVATLSSVLPMLVLRLKEIGLAPVFVIDELDKVHNLQDRMQNLVRHLKFLVTENSFSCFLADRRYFTHLSMQARHTAYAREYTYFSDRLLILYEPVVLRRYIEAMIGYVAPAADLKGPAPEQPGQVKEDVEKIAYVLLHRSRLHAIDLRRQLDRLAAKSPFNFADVFPTSQYQFELLMQVGVESSLKDDLVRSQVGNNPDSRQVIYDALYYVSRLWEDASETQLLPGFLPVPRGSGAARPGFRLSKESFAAYLESRCEDESEPGQPPCDAPNGAAAADARRKSLGGLDIDFLFDMVSNLVTLLADPEMYEIAAVSLAVESHIRNALPSQPLLENVPGTKDYLWLFDFSGRYLGTLDVNPVIREVEGDIDFIQKVESDLNGLSPAVNLQMLANCQVIPRTPEWPVVKTASDRLLRLMHDRREYGLMGSDRYCIVEYGKGLRSFTPNMNAALMCAAVFTSETLAGASPPLLPSGSAQPNPTGDALSEALYQVSQLLQLSAAREKDLERMNAILTSRFSSCDMSPNDRWEDVLQWVSDAALNVPPRDSASIGKSFWDLFRGRFTQRFRNVAAPFEPQFEDLYVSLTEYGPGRKLPFDLSAVTAADWGSHLSDSLEPVRPGFAAWLRVAAALELNLPELAERLANDLQGDALPAQWVRDFKLRPAATATTQGRRNVLIIALEKGSLTAGWKPSARHGQMVTTAMDFNLLSERLRPYGLSHFADFPFDLVCIELSGMPVGMGALINQPPTSPQIERLHPGIKQFEQFLGPEAVCYFMKDTPQVTAIKDLPQGSSTPPGVVWYVVAPKGIDDLVEHLPVLPPTTAPTPS